MHTIHYSRLIFETDDALAVAVLDYSERLAVRGTCAVVRIPSIVDALPGTMRLLIGSGMPIATQADTRETVEAAGPTVRTDSVDGLRSLDPFEVRRALHEIREGVARLDHGSTAAPFSPGTSIDDLWELALGEDPADQTDPGARSRRPRQRPQGTVRPVDSAPVVDIRGEVADDPGR